MKKVLAITLALLLVASLAACTGNKATDGNATNGKTVEPYAGELSALIPALYEKTPVELKLMDAMEVNYEDAWSVENILGIKLDSDENGNVITSGNTVETSGIKEAFYSEPMMSGQAYSLVVIRVAEGANVEDVKKSVFEGIDPGKWICAYADQVRAVSSKDVVMFIMLNSLLEEEFEVQIADEMVKSFSELVGELSGETLSRTPEETTQAAE